jgi:excisionase family DNA binding protein
MSTQTPPNLMSVRQLAACLGVSVKTVRRMIGRGDLPCYRIGRQLRIAEVDVCTLIASRRSRTEITT